MTFTYSIGIGKVLCSIGPVAIFSLYMYVIINGVGSIICNNVKLSLHIFVYDNTLAVYQNKTVAHSQF